MIISLKKLRKVIFFVIVCVIVVATISIAACSYGKSKKSTTELCTDNISRVNYLNLCGWDVSEKPAEEKAVQIPSEFNDTYKKYAELQRKQGFDLSSHKGQKAVLYTYKVNNYGDNLKNIYANLLICDNSIIGGEIFLKEANGFMKPLK